MSANLIKFTTQQICKLGKVPLMKTVCQQIWDATQTLLKSMLQYPDACGQVCKAITSQNYTSIARALVRVNQAQVNQDHTKSDIITYVLLSICILQGALLIGFFVKTQRDIHTRRERRAKAAASLREKIRPNSRAGLLPDVVEESLTKHKLIPKGRKLQNSFRYLTRKQLEERKENGRTRECEEALRAESSHL